MTFPELEANISKYLLLADRGILKLLTAVVIANRIPELDPTWLFIVSNSSGGKSELLQALAHAAGCWEQDDLSSKAFISGAKSSTQETSLLFRLPPNAIMIIKDLTLLLDKDQRESSAIFSQLRLIYDGKLYKSFGTGEDIRAEIKMGLIAGTTSAIEDIQAKQATMGQRTIRYYMKQPDAREVTRLGIDGQHDKEMRKLMANSFKEFLDLSNFKIPKVPQLLPPDVKEDLVQLSNMATQARSSIKRKEFARDNPIERRDLREMPLRMAKQLANLARAFMIMNDGPLSELDNSILYQIALDSIPSLRREILLIATRYESITLEALAVELKLPIESARIHLDDLVALGMITRIRGFGTKYNFTLDNDFRELISKFENIKMTNKVLDEEEPVPSPVSETEKEAANLGII